MSALKWEHDKRDGHDTLDKKEFAAKLHPAFAARDPIMRIMHILLIELLMRSSGTISGLPWQSALQYFSN